MMTVIPDAPLRIPDAPLRIGDDERINRSMGYPIGEWRSPGSLAKYCWFLI
jgi:hypothetical protein